MKTKLPWVLVLPLLMWSCEKDELYKTLDVGEFGLDAPADWESDPTQGFDSKTGRISNGKDALSFDYGWYSYDFRHETSTTHFRVSTTINGKPALIVRPKTKGNGVIGVFIQVDSLTKFNLYGQDIKNEDAVLKIFESVRFH